MDGANTPEADASGPAADKSRAFVQQARHRLRNIGALVASIAAVGAVGSGLLGYWNIWKTVRTDVLHDPQSVQKEATAKPHVAPRLSLVVLPFTNLNLDPAHDYFADAITNDLTTDLAKMPGAFVIGRGTAFAYKNKQIDPRALGKELGVRWAVQGAVQRNGDQVRVNVALTDLSTGGDVWSDRFDGDRANLAALQDQITARLGRSLNVELTLAEGRLAEAEHGRNPDAMDFTMRGWANMWEQPRTSETLSHARTLFQEALRLDPNNADAALGLAYSINLSVASGYSKSRQDDLNASSKMVDLALSKRPSSAMGHNLKGEISRLSGQPEKALPEYDIALGVDPNFPIAHIGKAAALTAAGRAHDAIAEAHIALRLSPKDPSASAFYYFLCDALLHAGEYDQGITECKRSIALNPKFNYTWGLIAALYALTGKINDARELVTKMRSADPNFTIQNTDALMRRFSHNEQYLRECALILDAFRKAGVPEQ